MSSSVSNGELPNSDCYAYVRFATGMTDTKNTREYRPDTGEEWRALGFYHEPNKAHRVWRLVGSASGLRTIVRMLASQADKASGETEPAALVVGPFNDFHIRIWERAGIDDESIHGSADDLRRLSEIIEQKLSGAAVGAEIAIGNEYAAGLEYTLLIAVRDEEFDPASQVPAIVNVPDDDGGEMVRTEVLPALPFKFRDPAPLTVGEGLIRLESDRVVIEFQTRDAILGMVKGEVKEVGLPFNAITYVRFKRGVFSAEIAIQGRDMKTMDGLPNVKQGRVRLRFKRDLRGDAEWFAMELERLSG
jgi:hypothetical protein